MERREVYLQEGGFCSGPAAGSAQGSAPLSVTSQLLCDDQHGFVLTLFALYNLTTRCCSIIHPGPLRLCVQYFERPLPLPAARFWWPKVSLPTLPARDAHSVFV